MTVTDSPSPGPQGHAWGGRVSLRLHAVVIIVLLIGEILIGTQLAMAGSPYPVGYLAAHVVVAVLLVGVTTGVNVLAYRQPRWPVRISATVTFIAAVGATFSGAIFLDVGQSSSALYAMEVLGGVALLGSILLIVWGGRPSSSAPSPTK